MSVEGVGATAPPSVVYLAGASRSGSTLLERVLGSVPGFVNVGELIDIPRRVARGDERCGCGEHFSECPFWVSVGERAFGGWSTDVLDHMGALQAGVARQRHIAQLLSPIRAAGFRARAAEYRGLYATLYSAVLATAGASHVVDASKWPAQALALCGSEINLRVVHVVRDVRGVAYSMQKDVERPQATHEVEKMERRSIAITAARWSVNHAETGLLRTRRIPTALVHYEDLVRDAPGHVSRVLAEVGLPPQPGWLDHVRDGEVSLGSSHGLSGNPSRFVEGTVQLRLDEAWRNHLSRRDRLIASTIGLPFGSRRDPSPSTPSATPNSAQRTEPLITVNSRLEPAAGAESPTADSGGITGMVSVVVSTRGRPELVRETLDTIVAQDYAGPIEILVIHDQEPEDQSLTARGTVDREIKVLSNRHLPGLAGSRNSGLEVAKGEFIATCDDDDLWHTDKVTRQVQLLREQPDLLVVGSGIRLLFPDRVRDWPARAARIPLSTLVHNRVKELHSSTLMMRRDTFAKAGRYDETLPHAYGEDYEFVLRVARVGQIGVVKEPLADIRKNVQSWFLARQDNNIQALEYLLTIHPELRASRRGHARILGQIAFAQSSLGRRRAALRTASKALVRYPLAPHAYLAVAQAATGLEPVIALKAARLTGRGLS
ncbi:glycosyltransferase family 2 protein [Segeticoccus rhizosphaerae]|jgi:hypothetical protein|uniref:glycosyltransferase family 2 protein n=1 Tax=Segeticoccus rhizosphaerae TaxID=1104777 RepID=UPI001264A848|nr:glycosyltransferase family A protein [Segeticoccus rhizosphaerae]